jgi:acyl-CoA synthetase (AMP-forming)/AMP-acid ligase II
MPRAQVHRALERFGTVFIQLYGQVETGLMGATLHPADHLAASSDDRRLGAAGVPSVGMEVRVVDLHDGRDVPWDGTTPGEILVKGPSVMQGYWRREEQTEEVLRDGWLRTSDIAVRDADGFIYLVDRARDMIVTGGINVFPREVEEIIAAHPAVDQVAVIGLPSDEWGEEVTAVVTLRGEADRDALTADILRRCADALAGYKKPQRVVFVDVIPLTGSGKISKRELRTQLLERLPDAAP